MTEPISQGYVYVDGHVHLYPEYDRGRFLQRGLHSARSAGCPLLLLLVESAHHGSFGSLRDDGESDGLAGMRLTATEETLSLSVETVGTDDPPVFLIAGRQCVSTEGLEVLIVGLDPAHDLCATLDRTTPAKELIERGLGAGALAILPWGFGKWIGVRGRLVAELASVAGFGSEPLFFLGDTSARCWPWPTPRSFLGQARVLPGTDILPLPGFEERLACYGFRVNGRFDAGAPFGSLVDLLRSRAPLEPFGKRDATLPALLTQLRLRLHARRA